MPDLSATEAAVYDRQLRVWGVETQKRLNAAKIVIVGCTGLAAEVAKNIVLAGCGRLTLIDDTPCAGALPSNFLVPAAAQPTASVATESAATLQEMNPLVAVEAQPAESLAWVTSPAGPDSEQAAWLQQQSLLLLCGADVATQVRYDEACTKLGVAFYAATSRGACCHFFANLHSHAYSPAVEGPATAAVDKRSKHTLSFAPLTSALAASWRSLRIKRTCKLFFVVQACALFELEHKRRPMPEDTAALRQLSVRAAAESGTPEAAAAAALHAGLLGDYVAMSEEMPAVNAVVGGVLANEVLKAVSFSGEPLQNVFFFDAHDGTGMVEKLAQD